MTHLVSWLLVAVSIFLGLTIYKAIIRIKKVRRSKKQIRRDNLRFNLCIDLILQEDYKGAIKQYNELLYRNGNRSFINGVLIGSQLPNTKNRLLSHKYQIFDEQGKYCKNLNKMCYEKSE